MSYEKKAFLTGATGFAGFHLAKKLLEKGWKLQLLVRKNSDASKLKRLAAPFALYPYDGTTEGLVKTMGEASPEVVFHLAACAVLDHEPGDVENLIRSNVLLGCQLLEGMRQAGISYFINAGSFWQHDESETYHPANLYAATKQAFMDILRYYTESSSIRALTLKLFNVYGPEDERDKLFTLWDKAFKTGQPLPMSPGEQLIDFVYIDDATEAFCHAAKLIKSSRPGELRESYAVSSQEPISLKEAARLYQQVTGRNLKLLWGERPYRRREVMVPWKGNPLPGWNPSVDLATGIRLTVEHDPIKTAAR